MLHRDSDFLARLLSGDMDEDSRRAELSGLSPTFQAVAARLSAARPEQRPPIWEDFLAGRLGSEPFREAAVETPAPAAAAAEASSLSRSARTLPMVPGGNAIRPDQRVRLTRAIDLEPREVEWLWAGRVPLGMITMFAGDPKLGKSFVTLAMAAAVSRGRPLPMDDRPNQPGSAILMSAEDDPARTIVPRLAAAEADLTKVHILESVFLANGSEALPSLRADVDAITAAASRLGDCRLIVVDPVSAYLKGVDDHRNAVLRGVLTPLTRLAEQLGIAVVLVNHLTKGSSANGKRRVLGSIAYVGACRANYLFALDPHDAAGRRVLMLDNGGNVAPAAPALAYVIDDTGGGPRVVWSDTPVPITIAQALRPQMNLSHHGEQADARLECDDWLRSFLANQVSSTVDIFKAGNDAGFTKDQIRRAKCRIGAVARREGYGADGRWVWGLEPPAFGY